jgi:hypothetical protein
VQRAVLLDRRSAEVVDRSWIADIGHDCLDIVTIRAKPIGLRGEQVLVAVGEHDPNAFSDQRLRDSETDAAGGARDHGDSTAQLMHGRRLPTVRQSVGEGGDSV